MRRRREVLGLLGALATWPVAVRAQQGEQPRRVGVLMNRPAESTEGQQRVALVRERLRQLGWREGQDLRIDVRWGADDPELSRKGAEELAALAPDAVLVGGTLAVRAMLRVSRTIPVVFAGVGDPVGLGVAASLARPGGNATGFSSWEYSFAAKHLELLKEIMPGVKRALVLRDPTAPQGIAQFAAIQSAASSLGIEVSPVDLSDPEEIARAIGAFAGTADGGLVVTASGRPAAHNGTVVELAARHRLPAVYAFRHIVASGGLISYGPNWLDMYGRAAEYVDRILKGAKPGDLPVQTPTAYELVVNLKTAKTLGLTVPASLLARADEVIE